MLTAENYKEKKSHKEYTSTFFTPFPGVSVPSKSTIHSLMEESRTFCLLQKKRQRTRWVPSDVRSARLKACPREYLLLQNGFVNGSTKGSVMLLTDQPKEQIGSANNPSRYKTCQQIMTNFYTRSCNTMLQLKYGVLSVRQEKLQSWTCRT